MMHGRGAEMRGVMLVDYGIAPPIDVAVDRDRVRIEQEVC